MSDRKIHNEQQAEFFNYLSGKMNNEERNRFERGLQRDPFESEALEGFEGFKPLEIEKDLRNLDVVSGKRKNRNRILVLSIAASVLILIVSGILLRNKLSDSSELMVAQETEQVSSEQNFAEIIDTLVMDSIAVMQDSITLLAENTTTLNDVEIEPKTRIKEQIAKKTEKKEVVEIPLMQASKRVEGIKVEPEKEEAFAVTAANENVANIVMQPDQLALEEMVVVGSVTQSVASGSSTSTTISANPSTTLDAKPEPLGGFSMFKQYLEENIVYPAEIEYAKREVVRVTFSVLPNGTPTNFVVDKSPNQAYSNEAIRLIKEGPKWSPGVLDGKPVQAEADVRIVFKPL